jgi:very-short-patch-repair endonuclease
MPRKLTQEEFIQKANKKHNNLYNYEQSIYINSSLEIAIECPLHGLFTQVAGYHLNGNGCQKCGRGKVESARKLTHDEFIQKAKNKHGERYDYSESIYLGMDKDFVYKCKKHGTVSQRPFDHLNTGGCNKCGIEQRQKGRTKSKEQFIKEAVKLHGKKYDYSLVNYQTALIPIKIKCLKHNLIFEQTPANHLFGQNCPECGKESKNEKNTKTIEKFIREANIIHNNFYDYSKTMYRNHKEEITISCPTHGDFIQKPMRHMQGVGCPSCTSSKGELKIRNYLQKNNIQYKQEKNFKGCRDRGLLRFDFYLPNYNLCIEYDGEQHFMESEAFHKGGESLENTQRKDQIKNEYCKNNNINLLRIPYWEKDNIENILQEYLKCSV